MIDISCQNEAVCGLSGRISEEETHCSLSMSMSFSSKSLWRSWPGLSNRNVTESPVSSACNQVVQQGPQHVYKAKFKLLALFKSPQKWSKGTNIHCVALSQPHTQQLIAHVVS